MSEHRSDGLRLPPSLGPERGEAFTFRFDGREITAHPGESIGAALLAAGIRGVRSTRFAGAPRGLLCGIGSCFDCLVTVDGDGTRRACLTTATPDVEVAPHVLDVPTRSPARTAASRIPPASSTTTVAVVGAGPAGMAAAVALAEVGVAVTVLDTYAGPGGQYHRRPAPGLERPVERRGVDGEPVKRRAVKRRGVNGRAVAVPRAGGRAAAAAPSAGGPATDDPTVAAFAHHLAVGHLTLRSATTIWTATVDEGSHPFVLQLAGVGGGPEPAPATLRAASVVLATGATDRVLPFPGSDLPGVVTVGGAQALLKGQGLRVGERVVVAGSGPFLLPVAAALAAAGTDVAAVAEAQPLTALVRHAPARWQHRATLAEGTGYVAALLRSATPLLTRSAVTAAHGDGRVEEVTLSRLDTDWMPVPGHDRNVAVDAAAVSFGFVPQVGLAALLGCDLAADPVWGDPVVTVDAHQLSSVPGVFAAGEVTGVAGAAGAAAEGALAGLAAAHAIGAIDAATLRERGRPHRRARARQQALAAALGRMYARPGGWVSWLTDETIVCRCEEVPYAAIHRAIVELDAADLRSIKLTTRCGMGRCQGRMCGDAVATILAQHGDTPPTDLGALSTPTVLVPITLDRLAALAGHADTPSPPPPPSPPPAPSAERRQGPHR
jgi:D-hydroxyproline dehydrogenase subunit alpha